MTPSPAFGRTERQQQCAVEPQQPVPGEPQPQGEPDEEEFDEATFASSLDLTPSGGAKVCRRKSKDVVPLHWNSGLSAIEPGSTLTANTTTASSIGSSRVPSPLPELEGTAKVEGGSSGREKTNGNMRATTIHTNGHGHAAQTNGRVGGGVNGVGSLPPPSSIPGLGVLTGGGASWMNNVGKKLGELRDSPTYVFFDWTLPWASLLFDRKGVPGLSSTSSLWLPSSLFWLLTVMLMSYISVYSFTKSQKRASVLLSDVSQSFVSAWNAPTTPIGSAPPISRPLSSRRLSTPLPSSPLSPSLLDDDNDDTIRIASVMTPDSKKTHPTTLMPSPPDGGTKPSDKLTTTSSNAKTRDEDEEWNW